MTILHVDMDAFYASVEQRDRPELRGKPVIVGGSPTGRGVVSTASYEARKFGVHSAMPTSQALRLCPQAILVRTRMSHYVDVSKRIRDIFNRYTPEVEPLSLDEAFLNVSGCEQLFGTAEKIGRAIKESIWNELNLVASVGVAPNKFLAKLASDLEKPDGFTVIASDRILSTLAPLPISRLWGVGKVTERRFATAQLSTFGDLQRLTVEQSRHLLGNAGEHFWGLARGIDKRRVVSDRQAKSISNETTFPVDIDCADVLQAWLLELTEQVCCRLRTHDQLGRTVQLKLRYSDFHTITRSCSVDSPTDSTDVVWQVAQKLLREAMPTRQLAVRLLGVGITNLDTARPQQLTLFNDEGEPKQVATAQIDSTLDAIRQQFGRSAMRRASLVQHQVDLKRGS
ncbi:DNA polymerase IV [Aureliella helgolandensis]|uniref:DNA polymerase IV n=1 Tax=Aureliella helgolandensis TaxID=2527968 RepID=A0A518G076_9BACT|nr:DNA polymerase IV [Aureliella helgolandensis]QDV21999.1 DNA polymerase IV [Aureliella helgolandensis]